ncbi:GGDEF domain-containing protein [Rheinheimera sp. 4Y26]|uniref:tetratricopeptide repeat-containing diguanylate cyclase n=1 Tax=Rheinheimera sp. 4Y26 TaxID=2977811 RepID=UPI0021B15525|nr:GGDEF domain-containing protein [Rheinheimera sp. 4Y26]MCT6699218.1 GGDEF domain-containing protein [Rheinheimera sp. 4Y26]
MIKFLSNKQFHLLKTVLCAVFFCFSNLVAAESDYNKILIQADEIKTTDHTKSVHLVNLIKSPEKLPPAMLSYYYYLKAYHAAYSGDYDNGIINYKKSIAASDDSLLNYRARISLANIYGVKRNAGLTMEYLIPALEESERVKDKEHKHNGLLVAAIVYSQFGLHQQALEVTSALLKDEPANRVLCYALAVKHESEHYQNTSADEQTINSDALRCRDAGQLLPSVAISSYVIYKNLKNKEFQKAKEKITNLMPDVEKTNYKIYISEYTYLLGAAQYGLDDYASAETQLKKSIEMNSRAGKTRPVIDSLLLLSNIKEKQKQFSEALHYYKRYSEAEKYYNEDLSSQKISFQLAKLQLFNKNQQIELLEKNNSLLKLEGELTATEAAKNRLFIILLVICLFSISYFTIKTLRSRKMYRTLAENDNLTGISNRYHFTQKMKLCIEQSSKSNQVDSFIIFDLDLFKQINDTYGHLTGDWVLEAVVHHCKQFVRNVDIFGRIGGEEFAVYMPACTAEKAALFAEILRDAISIIDCSGSGHPISITASFGVTSTDRSGYELRQLFRDADLALYKSKDSGRNRVTVFNSAESEI